VSTLTWDHLGADYRAARRAAPAARRNTWAAPNIACGSGPIKDGHRSIKNPRRPAILVRRAGVLLNDRHRADATLARQTFVPIKLGDGLRIERRDEGWAVLDRLGGLLV
jgi:hypothetical protein